MIFSWSLEFKDLLFRFKESFDSHSVVPSLRKNWRESLELGRKIRKFVREREDPCGLKECEREFHTVVLANLQLSSSLCKGLSWGKLWEEGSKGSATPPHRVSIRNLTTPPHRVNERDLATPLHRCWKGFGYSTTPCW